MLTAFLNFLLPPVFLGCSFGCGFYSAASMSVWWRKKCAGEQTDELDLALVCAGAVLCVGFSFIAGYFVGKGGAL